MPIYYANVTINNNFDTWLERTNQLLTELNTRVVTVNANNAVGNVNVQGSAIFSLAVGTHQVNANNVVSGNVVSNTLTTNTAVVNTSITSPLATLTNVVTTTATITNANITSSQTNTATINVATVTTANVATLRANSATINVTSATTVNVSGVLTANDTRATILSANTAGANTLSANTATIGQLSVTTDASVAGAISAASVAASGIVSGSNVNASGAVNSGTVVATGIVSGSNVNASMTVNAPRGVFSANVTAPVGMFTNVIATTANIATVNASNVNTTGTVASTTLTATGIVSGANVNASTAVNSPRGVFSANVSAPVGTFTTAAVTDITATTGSITTLTSNVVTTNIATITTATVASANVNALRANTATFNTLTATSANISGGIMTVSDLRVQNITISGVQAVEGSISTAGNQVIITGATPKVLLTSTSANAHNMAMVNSANTFSVTVDRNLDGTDESPTPFKLDTQNNIPYFFDQIAWHAGNDGPGSTLDSDLLDGQHGTYYNDLVNATGTLADARLPTTMTGKTFSTSPNVSSADPFYNITETDTTTTARVGLASGNLYIQAGASGAGANASAGNIYVSGYLGGNVGSFQVMHSGALRTIWHSGNQGAGSTLDADLLDGLQGAQYRDASNMNAGTLADARLPTTMTGKAFTGDISSSASISSGNGNFFANHPIGNTHYWYQSNGVSRSVTYYAPSASSWNLNLYNTSGTFVRSLNYDQGDGRFGVSGYLSVTGAAYVQTELGIGDARYYTDGNILFKSTMSATHGNSLNEALATKAPKASPSFTGTVTLPSVSETSFKQGTADGASYTSYNVAMKGWWGMGMQDHTNTVNGYYDFRAGKWDTKGGSFKNGVEYVLPNGGTYSINITGTAGTLKEGGSNRPMTFNWNGQGGQPDWLWGGVDGTNMYVYNPNNFSVANSAQLGGVAASSYATKADLNASSNAFQSGNQAYTINAIGSVAHGLGRKPNWYIAEMVCTTASNDWAVGDTFDQASVMQPWSGQGSFGIQVWATATTINWKVGANGIGILRKSNGGSDIAAMTNWQLRFRAGF